MIKNFDQLIDKVKQNNRMRLAVAAAQDEDVLLAVSEAKRMGLVEPILVGDKVKIEQLLEKLNITDKNFEIIDEKDLIQSAKAAVELVRLNKADFLMKGILQTADIMRAVLDKEIGLRTDKLISHVMVYQVENYEKLIYLTDGGMNVAPDLDQKVQILKNAIEVCKAMGLQKIYASCIAGAETVNPKIQATIDAKAIADMKDIWESQGVFVDGPVALDLAISEEACKHKGYKGEGGGKADILLVPYYEVGNALGKSLTYFGNAKSAGIIMGAKVPIVLVSRADTAESKLLSIALGSIIAGTRDNI